MMVVVSSFYSSAVLSALMSAVLCAIHTGVVGGHHIHPYFQHYQHQYSHLLSNQHQVPYNPHLAPVSGADAMYLRDGHLQNQDQLNQPRFHNQYHDESYLMESAKDPKNLKNGVYQPGAMTYDLGMPHYEIMNPNDPPEIITSDQPNYHKHLEHLQQSQNYTLEDFGVPAATPAPSAESTTKSTEDHQEPEPELDSEKETTTTEKPASTTESSKELKVMQRRIEKELSKTKEKLQKLSEQIKNKCDKNKVYTSHTKGEDVNFVVTRKKDNLRKKMRPTPFKPVTPHPHQTINVEEELKSEAPEVPSKSTAYNFYANSQSEQDKSHSFESSAVDPQVMYASSPPHHQTNDVNRNGQEVSQMTHKMFDLQSPHNVYAQSPSDVMKLPYGSSATDDRTMYHGQSASFSVQPKYPNYQQYQSEQKAYEAYPLSEDPTQMSLNSIQRLYRSASFLTTPENKMDSPASQAPSTSQVSPKAS